MIADIVISNYYFKLYSTRDTFLILSTSTGLSINITVPVILKRPSYETIYAFIREGCFCIEPKCTNDNRYMIIGSVELDAQKVIECFKEARKTELWRLYMEKSHLAKLDELLLNPEILISDKHKL
jgi:hypothetical protein